MGVPRDRVAEAHAALWIQQVGDVRTAELALEAEADVLVAQGWEAAGNAGWASMMVLVPQMVDAAPVTFRCWPPVASPMAAASLRRLIRPR